MDLAPRRLVAVFAILLLVLGLAACSGSSDGGADGEGDGTTTAAPSDDGSTGDDEATDPGEEGDDGAQGDDEAAVSDVDACALFSLEDMAAQMGADDVTATDTSSLSPTCTYESAASYLSAELSVLDEDQLANTPRDPSAYETGGTVNVLEVSGIGDEVFGYAMNGGVTMVAVDGAVGYSLLLTNAGGGDGSGSWPDDAAMVASAEAILTAVLAG